MKMNEFGLDWRGKFVFYDCIVIKVCLKYLNMNEGKKEMFFKGVKVYIIFIVYIFSLLC